MHLRAAGVVLYLKDSTDNSVRSATFDLDGELTDTANISGNALSMLKSGLLQILITIIMKEQNLATYSSHQRLTLVAIHSVMFMIQAKD